MQFISFLLDLTEHSPVDKGKMIISLRYKNKSMYLRWFYLKMNENGDDFCKKNGESFSL